MSDEIKTVHRYCREDDGEVCVLCPHCGWVIGLERGEFKGEQYRHTNNPKCGGWLQVSYMPKRVATSDELQPPAAATPEESA